MGSLILIVPLVLLAYLFWTQRKRQQQMRSAQNSLEIGQEVSTTSGLLGTLVEIGDEEATIEVSPGVRMRFVRRAVVPRNQVGASSSGTRPEDTESVDLDKHDDNNPETKAE